MSEGTALMHARYGGARMRQLTEMGHLLGDDSEWESVATDERARLDGGLVLVQWKDRRGWWRDVARFRPDDQPPAG